MASSEAAGTPPAIQDSRQHTSDDAYDTHNRGSAPGRHAKGRHATSPAQGSRGNRAGRVGRFESRSQQPGRWGHKPLPSKPVLPDNARQFGVVVTVKETFGFIKCYTGRRDQVFFHASELQAPSPQQPPADDSSNSKPGALLQSAAPQQQQQQQGRGRPDLPSMVTPGTPVEFTVIEGDPAQKRRTVAAQVKVLPPFIDTLQRGTVERDLRGGQRRQEDAYGGRITWQPPLPLPPAPASPDSSQHGAPSAPPARALTPVATPPVSPGAAAAAAAAEAALAGTGVEVHGLPPGLGHSGTANGTAAGPKTPRSGASAADGDAAAKQDPEAQKAEQQEAQVVGLPFEGCDLAASMQRLHIGDEVEFRVTLDRRSGQLKATEVTLVKSTHLESQPAAAAAAAAGSSRPSSITTTGARENGCIATLRDNFGFLMCADRDVRLFFHFSEVGFPKGSLAEGAELSFSAAVDEESGRESAVALQLLPPGTIAAAADTPLPEPVRGRVVKAASEARARQVQDGVAAFVDEAGLEFHCAYGNHQLPEGSQHPAEGDELQLSVVHNKRTGARRASAVSLVAKAADRRQLGQVKVLKNNWGLIRAVERPIDVFFHFSNVADGLEAELKVGDDVEFTLVRDSQAAAKDGGAKKLAAVRITRAPAGSAVFETLSEELLEGRVVERLQVQRGATVAPGAVEYADASGTTTRLAFGVHDLVDAAINPSVGEPVAFRLAVNHAAVKAAAQASGLAAAHAGRRATQVGPPAVEATVVSINAKGSLGFANIDAAGAAKLGLGEHTRMFFSTAEGVRVGRGDVVSMVVTFNPQTGERNGQRVKLLRQGEKEPDKPEFVAERNPNAVRYVGNKVEVQTVPQPRMPDGSRGFEPGAWCEHRLPLRPIPPPPLPAAAVPAADQPQPTAQPPLANGMAQRQPSPSLQQRQQQQQQLQRQQHRMGMAPQRPPLPASSSAAAALPRPMPTAFSAAAAEAPPQQGVSPPLPGTLHQRRLMGSRLGSGLLKADAPEFVPRLGSQGSLASELGVFLTPAASLSELGAAQLPASRASAPDVHTAAAAATAAAMAMADPFASAEEQLAGIRSTDSSFTAPSIASHHRTASDSSAFFTPAASLAVAGLEAAGLQPAQLQAVAARLETEARDSDSLAADSGSADGGPGADHPGGNIEDNVADGLASDGAAAVDAAAPHAKAVAAGRAADISSAVQQAGSAAASAAAEHADAGSQ